MFNPLPKRMKFSTKNVLVLTIVGGELGREAHRACPRFVFFVDTDDEKLAFIEWFLTKLQVTDLFEDSMPFSGYIANTPEGASMLYFESDYCEYEDDERILGRGDW